MAFALYLQCRQVTPIHVPMTKDRGKKTEHKIIELVSGWSSLPEPGGMLDQPNWTMSMFETFRRGENAGQKDTLK